MTAPKFDEGNSYFVHRLHFLDVKGDTKLVEGVAVVFTPGWVYVQESGSDGYVLPRERVLMVEGVRRAERPTTRKKM